MAEQIRVIHFEYLSKQNLILSKLFEYLSKQNLILSKLFELLSKQNPFLYFIM